METQSSLQGGMAGLDQLLGQRNVLANEDIDIGVIVVTLGASRGLSDFGTIRNLQRHGNLLHRSR